MLIVCKHRGWSLANYLDPSHPLQARIAGLLHRLAALPRPPSYVIDGCSLPSWVTSLAELASLYSRLALPEASPEVEGRSIRGELKLCFQAGVRHPEMIGGSGRLDTDLMRAYEGRVFAKTGADGVYAVAVKPGDAYPDGLAIAVKVADGDPGSQARALVIVEILRQLELLPRPGAPLSLAEIARTELKNHRGYRTGELRAVFRIC
jgi:L-asparaginase II